MNNGSTSNRAAAREEVMATMFVEGRVFAAGGAFALTDTNQKVHSTLQTSWRHVRGVGAHRVHTFIHTQTQSGFH